MSAAADMGSNARAAGVFALGMSCVMTQLAVMREMLGVFAGNELVLGVVLGNWLLLMGVGASAGRWGGRWSHPTSLLAGLLLLVGVIPPAQILVLRSLRQWCLLGGEALGVVATVVVSFLVLLPYCVPAGLFLAVACKASPRGEMATATGAGRVYMLDSLGSVAGGVLFGFVLVLWLDHIALLAVPALLAVMGAAWLAWGMVRAREPGGRILSIASITIGAGMFTWVVWANPDAVSTARQFPGQRVLFRGNSPYGRLLVTESAGQTNVIENGTVLVSAPNIEQAEESTHFALGQRPGAQRVLLIGGALSGAPREILRYGVKVLDCVELDPLVAEVGREYFPGDFGDARFRLHPGDARQFVRRAEPGYDVVIVAAPDPATTQLNRFFTHEFFEEVRRVLAPAGVLSFAVGRYENYAGPELSRLLSCARQTAAGSFLNVRLFPGGRVYFLASNSPLTTDLTPAFERAGVLPRWVTSNYLAATLAPDRMADLERAGRNPAPLNRDFAPALYYLHLRHWASQFDGAPRWWGVLAAMAAACYVARLRGAPGIIFASGFAGSALELVLLLAMQILAGCVYQQVAWVVTLFMAGLAVGAWSGIRWLSRSPASTKAERMTVVGRALTPVSAGVRLEAQRTGEGIRDGGGHPSSPRLRRTIGTACPSRTVWVLCLLGLGLAGVAAATPAILAGLAELTQVRPGAVAAQLVLLLITFGLATLVGAQFPLANALLPAASQGAARLYAADFIGAALGGLLTSAWLLPLVGMAGVCWTAAALNLVAVLFAVVKK